MKARTSILLILAALSPLVSYATTTQTAPDIEKKQAKKEDFKFYISAASGEIKPASNGHYTLTLSGGSVKNVIYKTFAPDHAITTVPMTQFAQYWANGKTFNKTPPNGGIVASDKKDGELNTTYMVNLKNISYSGGDKVSFDCTLLSDKKITQEIKLWKPVIIVDALMVAL